MSATQRSCLRYVCPHGAPAYAMTAIQRSCLRYVCPRGTSVPAVVLPSLRRGAPPYAMSVPTALLPVLGLSPRHFCLRKVYFCLR